MSHTPKLSQASLDLLNALSRKCDLFIDNAATASQNISLIDDEVTREAIRLNVFAPMLSELQIALSHPAALSGGDSVAVLTAYEAKKICERLEFDASWDKCGSGYYSLKRQIAALATAPEGSGGPKFVDRAKEKLKLWFFRDMNDEQRLKLFSLFGMPTDEIGKTHGHQLRALKHVLAVLAGSSHP